MALRRSFTQRAAWWKKRLGNIKICEVTADDVRDLLDKYAVGHAPATVNRHKSTLGAIYVYAQKYHGLPATINPARDVVTRTENNKRKRQ